MDAPQTPEPLVIPDNAAGLRVLLILEQIERDQAIATAPKDVAA